MSPGDKIPIGILKDKDDPEILADDEYPEWLWEVNRFKSRREIEKEMAEKGLVGFDLQELRRYNKGFQRNKIKAKNETLAKR